MKFVKCTNCQSTHNLEDVAIQDFVLTTAENALFAECPACGKVFAVGQWLERLPQATPQEQQIGKFLSALAIGAALAMVLNSLL